MGAPKRNRRKYEKPSEVWDLARIESDKSLVKEYGLKNLKELWSAETEIAQVRRNARELLSGASSVEFEDARKSITERLSRLGVASADSTIDSLLDLNERALLDRRLQTVVFKRGLSNTVRQARQLITHGFIAIGGRRITRPGYMVEASEESSIGYYKPIEIVKKQQAESAATQDDETSEQPEPVQPVQPAQPETPEVPPSPAPEPVPETPEPPAESEAPAADAAAEPAAEEGTAE